MSKEQPIETMPYDREFLAKGCGVRWQQVARVNKIHLYPDDVVINHQLGRCFLPDAWAELPGVEAEPVTNDEADAKRYRWLRDCSVPPHSFYLSVPAEFANMKFIPQEVDSYIDEAILTFESHKKLGANYDE